MPELQHCFDPGFYLNRYPDVVRSGLDPLAHFLLFGGREGRQPAAFFDVKYYLQSYPDVAASGANPLLHFLRFGWKEGRKPSPLFEAEFYAGTSPSRSPIHPNPFVDFAARWRQGEKPAGSAPFALPTKSYQVATSKKDHNKPAALPLVDVVIPVFAGFEETRKCLDSIVQSECLTPYHLILINDRSPDPALAAWLREAAAGHHWTLLENPENLGFAASINLGAAVHPDRDILLLNNDTEVAGDWLDRLTSAAYSGSRTGTVTPFSNNATLCSYPKPGLPNSLPPHTTLAELDRVFREVNAGHRIPVPTGVGFCMYIRRDCWKEAGEFRPEVFGKGYGEENDFCLRAIYKGWENLLAADTFVYHAGETSFASQASSRRQAAVERVESLHPGYSRTVGEHSRRDPAKPYRIAVSGWRMRQSGKPVILSITHDFGGGVERYVADLRDLLAGDAHMLVLTPTESGAVILRNLDPADDFQVAFDVESGYAALLELLRHCGVSRIHVQHLLGHSPDICRLQKDLGVHFDFSVHDYFSLCPQVTLTDISGSYCGEPANSGCNDCLKQRPAWPATDIVTWRTTQGKVVHAADRVIAPSQDAAERLRRYYPAARIVVARHAERSQFPPVRPSSIGEMDPLVVAVLGSLQPHKGLDRLRAVATAARSRNLPLRFVLAGYAGKYPGGAPEPFLQTGPYNKDDLPQRLRDSGAQVVWFPAQWPETYSYTLSECMSAQLPAVVPAIGAFPERVAGRSWTWVVPWDLAPEQTVDFFLAIRRDHFVTGIAPPIPSAAAPAPASFYPLEYLSNAMKEQVLPESVHD